MPILQVKPDPPSAPKLTVKDTPPEPPPASVAGPPAVQSKPRRAKQLAERPPTQQSDQPESKEAEMGVISSMLQDPKTVIPEVAREFQKQYFNNPIHRDLVQALLDMWDSGQHIDLITFTQYLSDQKLLEKIGGAGYVTELHGFVPSAVAIQYYMNIVREKYLRRRLIGLGYTMIQKAAEATQEESGEILASFSTSFSRLLEHAIGQNGSVPFEIEKLMQLDPKHDPNNLVGHRYLVRGGTALWCGPSGAGKSSLEMQFSLYWSVGQACFGLRPARRLKSLIVQAENDEMDTGEQIQGVVAGIKKIGDLAFEQSMEVIAKNVNIHRVIGQTGMKFISTLDKLIDLYRPDLVWIDPLFAFAGCDLMNAKETGQFLREGLFPLAVRRNCCVNVMHHIGKPHTDKNGSAQSMSDIDFQYLGFGTSEIQNAFRAVNVLIPVADSHSYRLIFSKRGERAGAKTPDGDWARSIYLEHSLEGICWLQIAEPPKDKGKGKSKFTHDHILRHMSVVIPMKVAQLLKLTGDVEKRERMSRASFFRVWDELIEKDKITETDDGWIVKSQKSQEVSNAA